MKKHLFVAAVAFLFIMVGFGSAIAGSGSCTTIQDGVLLTSDGRVIETGYDEWGYNYQAHIFNGKYCDAYRNAAWCQAWKNDDLEMKWNDAWLSNQDCNGDYLLDRHFGFTSYIGSGAWLTNHQKGTYIDDNGKKQRWEYFVKIVAAPADATLSEGFWYFPENIPIGPSIWGEGVRPQARKDPCKSST